MLTITIQVFSFLPVLTDPIDRCTFEGFLPFVGCESVNKNKIHKMKLHFVNMRYSFSVNILHYFYLTRGRIDGVWFRGEGEGEDTLTASPCLHHSEVARSAAGVISSITSLIKSAEVFICQQADILTD